MVGCGSVSDCLTQAGSTQAAHSSKLFRFRAAGCTLSAPFKSPGSRAHLMLLMVDNYDSFTYNLVQYLGELGEDVKVVRNDALGVAEIAALKPDRIVISP